MGLLVALSVSYGVYTHKANLTLAERLENANNNIEAYLEMTSNSLLAFTVLKIDMQKLKDSNDEVLAKLDSVRQANNIKTNGLTSAATQTQTIIVTLLLGVLGDLSLILKDTTYTDTILYNDLTKVGYTIGKDIVEISLDIQNELYLYTYKTREYKNKKSFFKRLFTLDFKKVDRYRYKIVNTNDLLKESNIRIVEQE